MRAYKLRYRVRSYLSVDINSKDMRAALGSSMFPFGKSLSEHWQEPLKAKLFNHYLQNTEGQAPDISDFAGNMVLSPAVYSDLQDAMFPYGEFLPVDINGEIWQIFNATTYLEADEEHSEKIIRNGRVRGLKALAFHAEEVEGTLLFRTPFDDSTATYCNEAFKQLIEEKGYSAVLFRDDLTVDL